MKYGLFFKVFLLLILLIAFSGINSESQDLSESGGSARTDEIKIIDIKVDSYSFEPDMIVLKANESVKIRLRSVTSIITHNFTIDYPDAGLQIDQDVPSGEDVTISFTPTRTGEYEFYCGKKSIFANHRKKGMVGTLLVVE